MQSQNILDWHNDFSPEDLSIFCVPNDYHESAHLNFIKSNSGQEIDHKTKK
jgi:hypothetical protein